MTVRPKSFSLIKIHFIPSPNALETLCGMRRRQDCQQSLIVPTEKCLMNSIGAPYCRTCFRVYAEQQSVITV